MKYYNYDVVFQEIPDETTLAINISNCPCHCEGCHSKFLWEDKGTELTMIEYKRLLSLYADSITCVCFMGGDANQGWINELAKYTAMHYSDIKVGWYTGRREIPQPISLRYFNYIKVGPYIKELGGLDSPNTNQRMYEIERPTFNLKDITYKFQKRNS